MPSLEVTPTTGIAPEVEQARFLRACRNLPVDRTPIWIMRQAGRYLPEYRALREHYDLLQICEHPELAAEVSLQPLRRFDLDAAILFSDIMIPLRPIGVDLQIVENVGPVIARPIRDAAAVAALRPLEPEADVPYVLQTIRLMRQELGSKTPLIGFAGGPFTLASYLVEGKPSRDFAQTKGLMYTQPETWHALMARLAQVVTRFLQAQVAAGVQAVQLFDSWVGALSPRDYREYVQPYSAAIFQAISTVPTIHFGTDTATLLQEMYQAGGDVIGLDWRIDLDRARQQLGPSAAVQGNLDPTLLLAPGEVWVRQAREILALNGDRPGHIFNLGHGIRPDTPPDAVARLVDTVHGWEGT
ncbi:MAG: uroporphyrinogen decarboxylase [Chloroflexi bacterium]|nr:uroporphyrinogen decarboxylase [Chloroflexota bacterium]